MDGGAGNSPAYPSRPLPGSLPPPARSRRSPTILEACKMIRLQETHDLPLGEVFHDHDDHKWIFIGWVITTTGKTATFVRSVEGLHGREGLKDKVWLYSVAGAETFEAKFREVRHYRKRNGSEALPPVD